MATGRRVLSKKKAKKAAHNVSLRARDLETTAKISMRQQKRALREKQRSTTEAAPLEMSMGAGTTIGGPESHVF